MPELKESLRPALEALRKYCEELREIHPQSKINPNQFSIMALISELAELYATAPTNGEAMGKDIDSVEAMMNTSIKMVKDRLSD